MSLEALRKAIEKALTEEEKKKEKPRRKVISTVATVESTVEKKKPRKTLRKPLSKVLAKHNTNIEEIRFIYYLLLGRVHRGKIEEAIDDIISKLEAIKKDVEALKE